MTARLVGLSIKFATTVLVAGDLRTTDARATSFRIGDHWLVVAEQGTSAELVASCAMAIRRIGTGKKIVVIDGVGYPSVGSIVGCSSVDIAKACDAKVPVTLILR